MKILDYNDVDSLKVFYINPTGARFSANTGLVAHIPSIGPAPFPCLGIYAVEGNNLLGQVESSAYRWSHQGREDCRWGMGCIYPFPIQRAGSASRLLGRGP